MNAEDRYVAPDAYVAEIVEADMNAQLWEGFLRAVDAKIDHFDACSLCRECWASGRDRNEECIIYRRLSDNEIYALDRYIEDDGPIDNDHPKY